MGRSLGIYESSHHGSLYMRNKKGGCPWTIGDLSTRAVAVVFIGGFSKYPKKRLKRISYLSSFNDMLFFLMGGFNPLKTMTIISANHLKYGPFLNKETINQFSSIRLFRDHQPAIHGCQRAQTKAQHPFPSASNSATSPGEPCPKILQSPMQKMLLVMLWVKTLAP